MPCCTSCASVLPEGARFCASCGAASAVAGGPGPEALTRTSIGGSAPSSVPSEEHVRFLPGTIIGGRYRIVGPLGRGGMGEVFRADDLRLGRVVALKFLPQGLEQDAERLRRFLMEARVALNVTHPNVCRVHDIGELDDQHYISMEFVDGEDLGSLLRRIGRLPEDKAIEVARQICAGLAAAHEQGVVHRDLKPANVMIDGRGQARITDFGLAAVAERVTGADARSGTPDYMAPEQLDGLEATARSDLYSLGLVLYELFTGRRPFDSRPTQASRSGSGPPSSLATHVDGIDPAVERAIFHCLEPAPENRPSSALVVAAALPGGDPLAAALAAGELPSPELIAAVARADASSPLLAWGIAALSLAVFVIGVSLGGRFMVRAWVPLERPPIAMTDRARDVIERLGYTEPVYADPTDHASGYNVFNSVLNRIATESEDSVGSWERLADPDLHAVTYWYRQSPRVYSPAAQQWGTFAGGSVTRWNPFPMTSGETLVSLDVAGRLEFFVHTPRRYLDGELPGPEPDWSAAFELAGLSMDDFEPTEPRYQRFMNPQWRAAWIGPHPGFDDAQMRIEAGGQDGRIVLFTLFLQDQIVRLAALPESDSGWELNWHVFLALITVLVIASVLLARRNMRVGRADWHGAKRLGGVMFTLTFVSHLLMAHGLMSSQGIGALYPITATALFYAVAVMGMYLAVEPWARRIWPAMLVSWSRALGRTTNIWRDAAIGRSALWGALAGATLSLIPPLEFLVRSTLLPDATRPSNGNWQILLGSRQTLAEIVDAASTSVTQGLMLTFIVIAMRLVFRRPVFALIAAAVVWILLGGVVQSTPLATTIEVASELLLVGGLLWVLLRQGVLGLAATMFTGNLAFLARTADWSAWHARPTWTIVVVVAILMALAARAASVGRAFAGDLDAAVERAGRPA